jgi:two-component system, sensor histidine kinase
MLHSNVSIRHDVPMTPDGDAAGGATGDQQTAVICHELRNSIAVVRGATRLVRATMDSEGLDKLRSLIDRQLDQIARHVDDLVSTRRRDDHDQGLYLSKLDLRLIAGHALDAIAPELARRQHHLTVKLPPEPVWMWGDAARLEQAVSNLLINAIKYTPDGGRVTLALDCGAQLACLRVADSGVGIEAAMLTRIFGMFVQVGRRAPSLRSGSGIGLAVVREVVEFHGGNVAATSAGLGLGSEFIMVLPTLGTPE